MQDNPLVTVYIPTYNRVELLKRAIESVRNQTYQNLEIIIVDDCSQDATAEYLKEISKKDSRIRYFIKEKNSGACASRNIAINNARGEYITGLDDDDLFHAERIKYFLQYSKKYDMDKSILFSVHKFGLDEKITIKNRLKTLLQKKKVSQKDLILNNYIGNQIFVKTEIIKSINGFDESFKMWQDLDCWYRLLENRTAYLVPQTTYFLDTHHGYERITNINKLNNTYSQFVNKHELNNEDRQLLTLHFFPYGELNLKKSLFLKRILTTKNVMDIYYAIKFLTSKLIKND